MFEFTLITRSVREHLEGLHPWGTHNLHLNILLPTPEYPLASCRAPLCASLPTLTGGAPQPFFTGATELSRTKRLELQTKVDPQAFQPCPLCESTYKCVYIHAPTSTGIGIFTIHTDTFYFLNIFIYWAVPGLSCGMWDLVPWPGIEPRPPALRAQSLSCWTSREVPYRYILNFTSWVLSHYLFFYHISSHNFQTHIFSDHRISHHIDVL